MNSFSMTLIVLVASLATSMAGGVVPAAVAAPVIAAPAAVGYAKAIPYNVPPFASRVDISTRALASPYIAAAHASPYIAPAHASPYITAAHAGPIVAAPAPVAAAHSAPIIAASGPLTYGALPAHFAAAPAFVHSAYAGSLPAPLAAYAAHGPAVIG